VHNASTSNRTEQVEKRADWNMSIGAEAPLHNYAAGKHENISTKAAAYADPKHRHESRAAIFGVWKNSSSHPCTRTLPTGFAQLPHAPSP